MKVRLKALIFISILVLLYATYYWGVPLFINIQSRVPLIREYVKKEMGAQVELKNPKLKMGLTPAIWVDASYFSLSDKNSTPFSVVNPRLKIGLIPLLFGHVHLTYFSCDRVNANLKIDKNYKFYIGDFLFMKDKNYKFSIEDSTMDIESYSIHLNDEVQNKTILIDGDYFNLENYNSQNHVKFSTNSKIKIDERYSVINANVDIKLPLKKGFDTNEILFDGTVTNLNLSDLSPYIKKLTNNQIKQTDGIINIQADTKALNLLTTRVSTQLVVNNLAIMGKDKSSSIYFKNKLNAEAVCDFSKNKLVINRIQLLSGNRHVDITGKINKISSKKPFFDLTLLLAKSKLENLISLFPNLDLSTMGINVAALKKYGIYGDVEGEIFIKGKKPKITGNITLKNAYVIKPLPANIPKANVKLKFLGEKLYLDVFYPVSQGENVKLRGPVELFGGKKADFEVISTQKVDLNTTESVLNPLHEIFYFELGPLPIMKLTGIGNVYLKIKGKREAPQIFGYVNIKNATASFNGIDMLLKKADAILTFKDKDAHFISKAAYLNEKPIKIEGNVSLDKGLDFDIVANGQDLNAMLILLKNSPLLSNIQNSIPPLNNASGKINLNLKLKGKIKSIEDFIIGKTVIASGNIKLLGNGAAISNLLIPIKGLFGNIKFDDKDADFDLYSFVDKSKIYIKGKIRNKIITSKLKLDDLAFSYANIPVKIVSGNLDINNDKIILYNINGLLDSMPILIDGMVSDIFKDPNANIYVNSKLSQKFIEKYINKNTTYPLKVKGDIIYSSRIKGTRESFNLKTDINLQEDSNIYYMGSTLGDLNNPIRIFLDANISKNIHDKTGESSIYVNSFQYDKLISSQNNKEFISPQLNAKGQINLNKNGISLRNFRIKTQNPTDAKLFNILFKKSMIKQGLFSSNIIINNSITSPKLLGFLNFTGIDIPLLDTTIKDISLDFNDRDIDIKSRGEIFSNEIIFLANLDNRLTKPYTFNDMDISLGNFDINETVKSLNKLDLESNMNKISEQKFDISNLVLTDLMIKKAKIKAQSVFVKNLFAKDFTADFSLNEKLLFSLDNFKFDIAQGSVNGNFKYNLLNSNSSLNLKVSDVNANSMAEALFDLKNQVFGSLTGQVELTCNQKTHKTCMDTLSGKGGFTVKDGRMPKLGSLEYLLKAANLVKSGVTGLTINSIIDLITPLKTGQFENINGMFTIKSGIADEIQIFSKGKDLSLFLTGTYNFSTLVADMEVFGRISKKISNVLGPIGNTSLNTLFNTIPGLNLEAADKAEFIKNFNKIPGFELNDKMYRIFSAEIYGDINGDNYVQSFKWVE